MKRFDAAFVALATALAVAAACTSKTAGMSIELTLAFEGAGPRRFVTASGWEVELSEARALVGPVYAYAPAGASALRRVLGPARAFAHGGTHPFGGRVVRAELLELAVLDALAGTRDVATLGGLAGEVEALTLVLAGPEDAAREPATHGHAVWVAGVARRDGAEVAFEGGLDLADERLRRIDGIEVGAALEDGARLVVGADPSAWLAEADFTGVSEGALAPDGQPLRALFLGARSAASFTARIEPQSE